MRIRFSCECGAIYEVPGNYAGKTLKCKACEQPICVPQSSQISPEKSPSKAQAEQSTAVSWDTDIDSAMAAVPFPPMRKPIAYSPEAQSLRAKHARNEQGQGFTAANPALLRVNLWKYFRSFPYPFMLRLGLLAMALGLSTITCIGYPLVLACAYFMFRLVQSVRKKFVSGCICPARILTVDPPVIAVYSDLSLGVGSCKVIRLMEQPLHRLEPFRARPGRISTVCFFQGMCPGFSDHWFMPLPTITELASNKTIELKRAFDSIPDSLWEELEQGLTQLPENPEFRTYRVIRRDFEPKLQFSSPLELQTLCQSFLPQADGMIGSAVTNEVFNHATRYLTYPVERSSVIAIVQSFNAGAIITGNALIFFFRDDSRKPITIPWASIKVAYTSLEHMEILTIADERILIPCQAAMLTMVQLEKLINRGVGVGPQD